MSNIILMTLIVVLVVPGITIGYVFLIERLLGFLPTQWHSRLRPWLWLGPAFVLLTFILIYPTLSTIGLSFFNEDSTQFVGLDNYIHAFTAPDTLIALRNSTLWLTTLGLGTVFLGLIIAVLFDRVRYEPIAKAILFLPMAISS